jgi:hypothetical protein
VSVRARTRRKIVSTASNGIWGAEIWRDFARNSLRSLGPENSSISMAYSGCAGSPQRTALRWLDSLITGKIQGMSSILDTGRLPAARNTIDWRWNSLRGKQGISQRKQGASTLKMGNPNVRIKSKSGPSELERLLLRVTRPLPGVSRRREHRRAAAFQPRLSIAWSMTRCVRWFTMSTVGRRRFSLIRGIVFRSPIGCPFQVFELAGA